MPDAADRSDGLEYWTGMMPWISGHGYDYSTWVAVVEAESESEAWSVVKRNFGSAGSQLRDRGITSEITEPCAETGRFPGKTEYVADFFKRKCATAHVRDAPEE